MCLESLSVYNDPEGRLIYGSLDNGLHWRAF
jgi:hypothetical protein